MKKKFYSIRINIKTQIKIINKKTKVITKEFIINYKSMKYHINKCKPKRITKRFIRHSSKEAKQTMKKKLITKKENAVEDLSPILSPYNSNEYLIKNQSSPFYDENDEEDLDESLDMFNGFKEIKNSELNSNDMNSTFDVSEILNESIEEQEKQEKKIGENATEKQKNLKAC